MSAPNVLREEQALMRPRRVAIEWPSYQPWSLCCIFDTRE